MMNVTNATTTTKTRILKKRSSIFRTKNQQATINNVDTLSSSSSCQHRQQRRTVVRFHHQVAIHQVASSLSSSSTSSTWLSLAEYNAIRSRVFETLDQHYYPHNNNSPSSSSSSSSASASSVYCFRGLEEYCPKNKGAFHEHVRARRKHVVSAVLQRQRTLPHGSTTNNKDKILRQVSERSTQPHNLHQGLTRGADDSHAAFTVYAEQRQPPPPPLPPAAAAAPHLCPPPAAAEPYRHKEISREYEPMLPPIVTHPTVLPKNNSMCRLNFLMPNE